MVNYKEVLIQQYDNVSSNPQTKSYFGVLATLVLLIILVILIFPAVRHVTEINKEITDAREVKAKLENKLEAIDQAKENLAEVQEDLPLLDLALPVGSDMPEYFVRVNKLASKHKLKISAVQFSDVPLSKPSVRESELVTKDFIYSITLEGGFPNFRSFLSDLENLIRISDVNTVMVVKEKNTPLKHTLGVSSFFLGISLVSPEDLGLPQQSDDPVSGELPNE